MPDKRNKSLSQSKPQNSLKHSRLLSFCLALTLLSFAVVCQINFESNSLQTLEQQSTENLVTMMRSLNDYRSRLNAELKALERSESTLSVTTSLEQQLQSARIFAGSVAVSGPGVSVTITADYDLYSMDVIDITNELKVSGAEAIAINNQRLTSRTRVTHESDQDNHLFLALDGKRLLTPIVITAIGDPATLEKGLTFTGGIIDNLNALYGIYPIVRQEENITIPAASQPTLTHMQPLTDKENKQNQ